MVIVTTIETVITEYNLRFLLYVHGFYDFETNIHAKIDSELLVDVEDKLNSLYTETCNYYDYTVAQNNSVQDLIRITLEDIESYTDPIDLPANMINRLRLSIEEYDYKFATLDLSNIQEMITHLKTIIGRMDTMEEVEFTSEAIAGIITAEEIEALSNCIDNTYNFYTENEKLITEASEHQAEVFEQIEAELAQEREKMGWIQVAMSSLGVVTTGILCVMCPPLAIAGAPLLTYNASNLYEGCENVVYGSMGDAYTPAYNPGRDSDFNGD